ncbi:MAG: hypothetical protein H7Y12_02955 [Sphingobacteriaceae bacterium]|nr:hypothetical protein [Cytophagaceae bacterium]
MENQQMGGGDRQGAAGADFQGQCVRSQEQRLSQAAQSASRVWTSEGQSGKVNRRRPNPNWQG